MIQVHAGGVLVLQNALLAREVDVHELRKIAEIKESADDPLGARHYIVEAHVLDPYLALRLSDGSVFVFSVSENNESNIDAALGITPTKKKSVDVRVVFFDGGEKKQEVSCIGLFNSLPGSPLSRVINFKPGDKLPVKNSQVPTKPEDLVHEEEHRADVRMEDDEMLEEMLFGEEKKPEAQDKGSSKENAQGDIEQEKVEEPCARNLLTLAMTNGVVEFWLLPELTLIF